MRAVWLVLVAGFRRQWRSWVLLGLLIAVASGFVLASTAAGRRTDAAFPRYVASHGYDAIVYTVQPLPKGLPGVAHVTPVQMPFYDQPLCSCHRRSTPARSRCGRCRRPAWAGWPSWWPAGCPTRRRPSRRWRRSRSSVTTACAWAR